MCLSFNIQDVTYNYYFFFPWFKSPLAVQDLLVIEGSRSYSDTTLGRNPLDR
jgi:uncharacterized protein YigE (DUF2233 family)